MWCAMVVCNVKIGGASRLPKDFYRNMSETKRAKGRREGHTNDTCARIEFQFMVKPENEKKEKKICHPIQSPLTHSHTRFE